MKHLPALLFLAMPALAANCADSRDLKLINGKIATMDKSNTTVSEVTIQNGRFDTVGKSGAHKAGPCEKVIDLQGATVVPGLIDNHDHIVLLGMRPGYDIRLETAASIEEVQAKAKTVPAGSFITTLGDWNIKQFREKRLPTLAELDWYTHEEDKMGTIEPGKFGDLAVLSSDYFDPRQVSDDAIKHITSVLTVVDGKVVHDVRKAGR